MDSMFVPQVGESDTTAIVMRALLCIEWHRAALLELAFDPKYSELLRLIQNSCSALHDLPC